MLVIAMNNHFKSLPILISNIGKTTHSLQIWLVMGDYGSLKVIDNVTVRQLAYDFLLAFHTIFLSCIVSEMLGNSGPKSQFFLPHVNMLPPRRGSDPIGFSIIISLASEPVHVLSCSVSCDGQPYTGSHH